MYATGSHSASDTNPQLVLRTSHQAFPLLVTSYIKDQICDTQHVVGKRNHAHTPALLTMEGLRDRGVAGLTAGLHAHQLQLNAADGGVRVFHHQLPRQGLRDDAVGRVEVSSDEEFGEQGSLE